MYCRYCLAYAFVPVLERELNEFRDSWNSHTIRKNRNSNGPAGKPEDLYDMPAMYGRFKFMHVRIYTECDSISLICVYIAYS